MHLQGIELGDDPYQELSDCVKEASRDDIKRICSAAISTQENETHTAFISLTDPKDKRDKPIRYKTSIAVHKAINKIYPWFKNARGIGLNLQSLEGQILLDTMIHLLENGITAIPIHDALRVPEQHKYKAAEIMKIIWSSHLGVDFETKITFKNLSLLKVIDLTLTSKLL